MTTSEDIGSSPNGAQNNGVGYRRNTAVDVVDTDGTLTAVTSLSPPDDTMVKDGQEGEANEADTTDAAATGGAQSRKHHQEQSEDQKQHVFSSTLSNDNKMASAVSLPVSTILQLTRQETDAQVRQAEQAAAVPQAGKLKPFFMDTKTSENLVSQSPPSPPTEDLQKTTTKSNTSYPSVGSIRMRGGTIEQNQPSAQDEASSCFFVTSNDDQDKANVNAEKSNGDGESPSILGSTTTTRATLEATIVNDGVDAEIQDRLDALERQLVNRADSSSLVRPPVVSAVSVHNLGEEEEDHPIDIAQQQTVEKMDKEDSSSRLRRLSYCSLRWIVIILLLIFGIVITVAVVIITGRDTNDEEPPMSEIGENATSASSSSQLPPTLTAIRNRGHVRCGIPLAPLKSEGEQGYGFSFGLCRAVAAAIFDGNVSKTEFPDDITWSNQWALLAQGQLDLITDQTTYTMERDVFYAQAGGNGMAFSRPWMYAGTIFAGRPDMVQCAERGDTLTGACSELLVCVTIGTTTEQVVLDHFDGIGTVNFVESAVNLFPTLVDEGKCNVIAGEPYALYEQDFRDAGYQGEYAYGTQLFSKEPLAMVSRGDDVEFAQFVDWILHALITAEAMGITQETAKSTFPPTNLFGDHYQLMFQHAVAAVGNYGELYARTMEERFPRSGMNHLKMSFNSSSEDDGGLMYALPFGSLSLPADALEPSVGETLKRIENRGIIVCGVVRKRPWLGISDDAFGGIDAEYCLAMAIAVFGGQESRSQIAMTVYNTVEDGIAALLQGRIDIFASTPSTIYHVGDSSSTTTIELSVLDEVALSPAYFYSDNGIGYSLATRSADIQWSEFCRWVIWSTIHAEEESIVDATELPIVELFGPNYAQMLRFVHLELGHYGDIYNRTTIVPRSNLNQLNDGASPQFLPRPQAFGL